MTSCDKLDSVTRCDKEIKNQRFLKKLKFGINFFFSNGNDI